MRALVAAPNSKSKIELRDVPEPRPRSDDATVEVRAVSLNRGEVRSLGTAPDGWRPGWDLAGVVIAGAADGSGPRPGSRAVGLVREGAWAERVAVPTSQLAELPAKVDFAAASTLPIAGVTALRALAVGGLLLGKRVLITGAAGGVGRFAVQLARRAGAHVTAVVGRPERAAGLKELGADEIIMALEPRGPSFDLILESAGGGSLAAALYRVGAGGTVVVFGNSSGEPATFDPIPFYRKDFSAKGPTRVYGLRVFDEFAREGSAAADLSYLTSLLAAGQLDPGISITASWREAGRLTEELMARRVAGKAVMMVD